MRRGISSVIRRVTAIVVAGAMLGGPSARAAIIAGWDFQTTGSGGTAVAVSPNTPTVFVANVGAGTLYLDGSNGSSSWAQATELNAFTGTAINATNGLSTTTASPAALAVVGNTANDKSIVFKFSMLGYQDLVISLAAQRSSSGFTTQVWEYGTNGTTYSTIGSLAGGSTAGTIATGFITSGTLTLPTVSGFDNATDAYVRVTFSGASSSSGNNRLDNIQFNASTFTPPSSILTWSGDGSAAGGPGAWTAAGTNWSASGEAPFDAAWDTGARAVFGTTGGTVTVDAGGITVDSGLDFQADGYTLTGGGLTIGGASSVVSVAAAATATIDSAISGTNGLAKTSAGTLVLGGANDFIGNVSLSAGTLQIASDSALGDAENDVAINATLRTVGDLTLGAGRSLNGSATLDISPASTLTVAGSAAFGSTTLPSAGTLSLQGDGRSLGALTFGTAATVAGAGPVGLAGINASAVTSGTALVQPGVTLSAGDQQVSVGSGGTLVIGGDIAGSTNRIVKSGGGTLVISGSNSTSFRIGTSGTAPVPGGTVIVAQNTGAGTSQIQVNVGTLQTSAPGGLTFANGVSIGGRTNGVAVFGGTEPLTFSGSSSFFRQTATTGELRFDVDNRTTFTGQFGATSGTSGGASATGITIGGTGRLTLAGNAAALTETITLQDGVGLVVDNALGGSVVVGAGNTLGGSGVVAGTISGAGRLLPGNSPGILTAAAVDPSGGLGVTLEFTGLAPAYSSPTASVNDVIRLTGPVPFASAFALSSAIDIFLGVSDIAGDAVFEGGFFTDTPGDFLASISGATTSIYVLGNGAGTDRFLEGQGYYSFSAWNAAFGDPSLVLALGTVGRTADLGAGDVEGQVMVLNAVPEPGPIALGGVGVVLAGLAAWKRRRRH